MYTASSTLLDALTDANVSYIFANFGSDHPALVEAIAEARANGRPIPEVITCPNEMVGMSAAHGFWQASGVAQAVVVHVECGTQALAGAVHNAAKGRAPMMIFAGASPFTQDGELKGSRNEFIQWIQDVHDQRGIVRGYTKYDNELRTGFNVKDIVNRALQLAYSDPKGPVYLMGAREVMEQEVPPKPSVRMWPPVQAAGLTKQSVAMLGEALRKSRRPLVVTTYLGRNEAAFNALVEFSHRAGAGVLESVPTWLNFPHSNPMYQGNHWNHPWQNKALASADLVLVIDSDVPWIPAHNRPAPDVPIFHIDVDPLKTQMPLWHIDATASWQADAATALSELNEWLTDNPIEPDDIAGRADHWRMLHEARAGELAALEKEPEDGVITSEFAVACLREEIGDDALFVNEGISNYHTVFNHLRRSDPLTVFTSGGGSLGYNGGAAIGVKLASPEKTVVALCGDGSYMFSVPSSVHWMAARYQTPFLQIVFNNRGWKSPKLSTLAVHPDGFASRANSIDVSFDPPPDYAGIAAAAGGAHGKQVRNPAEVRVAIREALEVVRTQKRCAVLDIWISHL
ncbi:thiamine pyrophosphate-requiring protein [Rhizobium binae]|uniref:thiamine pyrophosphate-requiring protein n=1 Tax=Rhizobium binae TaxID=1138190 RepID=UPI001C83DFC4|nr:thiamine pyrophosphate-requiring protein [Rhizobium binae]MBX4939769.1 thiamine pyrophosphate-requiring protein [Rhizobium binae]MBX4946288.1 thiamine pyrophosphate-requiring protein [Rhizobium binae]MBX4961119.1 thiamine pyrophosphate-requiring protein [Rhizobium binae]MBX4981753.1 thiamine pyrophosphate-requiring protein [Rhizobium binae]